MSISFRIGIFLSMVGALSLIIFFASDTNGNPEYSFFLIGVAAIVAGFTLIRRRVMAPPPSNRFRLIRKIREKPKKEEK